MGCCDSSAQLGSHDGIFGAGAGVAEGDAASGAIVGLSSALEDSKEGARAAKAAGSEAEGTTDNRRARVVTSATEAPFLLRMLARLRQRPAKIDVAWHSGAGVAGNFATTRRVMGICDNRNMGSPAAGRESAGTWLLLLFLRFYQTFFSPFLGGACKFYPSCSRYAQEAIAVHGARRGAWLAMKRLGRCRPLTKGGFDPVPDLLPWQKSAAELGGSESERTRGASAVRAAGTSEAYVVAKQTTPKPMTHKSTTDQVATEKSTARRAGRACPMPDYSDAAWLRSAGKERAQ